VRMADEQRAGYLRRFYNVDWLDCSLYDLVINTDQIPPDVAVQMIAQAAQVVADWHDPKSVAAAATQS